MLLLISVYLFRVLHLSAQQLKDWSCDEPNRDFPYAAAVSKETTFTSLLNVVCLKFLDQKFLLQLFLNCDNFCVSLPFHCWKTGWHFIGYADWVYDFLALSLLCYCREGQTFGLDKDRQV